MEGENEITVVVENRESVAETIAASDVVHAEARVEVANVEAARDIAIAETQAEAIVAVAEAQAAVHDEPPAWALALVAEVTALRAEVVELRTAAIVEEIAEEDEEDEEEIETPEVIAIESGETPASVVAAEVLEPVAPGEPAPQEKTRKRHFVSL